MTLIESTARFTFSFPDCGLFKASIYSKRSPLTIFVFRPTQIYLWRWIDCAVFTRRHSLPGISLSDVPGSIFNFKVYVRNASYCHDFRMFFHNPQLPRRFRAYSVRQRASPSVRARPLIYGAFVRWNPSATHASYSPRDYRFRSGFF